VTRLSAGYETMEFERTVGRSFTGPVLEAHATWSLSDITRVEVNARRAAYQSFFVNNNFYINNLIGLRVTRQAGRKIYWTLATNYQLNRYSDPVDISVTPGTPPGEDVNQNGLIDAYESFLPSQGVRRRDHALTLEAGSLIFTRWCPEI